MGLVVVADYWNRMVKSSQTRTVYKKQHGPVVVDFVDERVPGGVVTEVGRCKSITFVRGKARNRRRHAGGVAVAKLQRVNRSSAPISNAGKCRSWQSRVIWRGVVLCVVGGRRNLVLHIGKIKQVGVAVGIPITHYHANGSGLASVIPLVGRHARNDNLVCLGKAAGQNKQKNQENAVHRAPFQNKSQRTSCFKVYQKTYPQSKRCGFVLKMLK